MGNALTQSTAVVTGLQDRFDWRGVAASAVGAGVGSAVGGKLGDSFGGRLATGLISGAAASVMRGGRIAVQQVATDAFGNAIGSSIADYTSTAGQQNTSQEDFRRSEISDQNRKARSDEVYGWGTGDSGLGFKGTGGAAMRYGGMQATDYERGLDFQAGPPLAGMKYTDAGWQNVDGPINVGVDGAPTTDNSSLLKRVGNALPNIKSGYFTDTFLGKALNSDVPVLHRQLYGATLPLVGVEQMGIALINAPGRIVSAIDNATGVFSAPTAEGKIVAGLTALQDFGEGVGGLIPLVPASRMTNALQFGRSGAASDVWALDPFERGQVIEKQLGQNLPGNFPKIDKFENGLATSIKSLDLNAPTYQNATTLARTLRGYVDDVVNFNGRTWAGVTVRGSDISGRALDLAVPQVGTASQQRVIDQTIQYGTSKGVTVNVIQIR